MDDAVTMVAALLLLLHVVLAAAAPPPPPSLAFAFSAMQANNCGGGFPMCPSQNQTPAIYSQFVAQDLAARLERVGPTTLLPPARNQVLVSNFKTGFQYGLNVDASVKPFAP